MRFTNEQRAKYVPDPCPACGGTVDQAWCDATSAVDHATIGQMSVPGRFACRTPGCSYGSSARDPLPVVDVVDMIAFASRLGFDPRAVKSILVTSHQVNATLYVLSESGHQQLGEDGRVRTELVIRLIR